MANKAALSYLFSALPACLAAFLASFHFLSAQQNYYFVSFADKDTSFLTTHKPEDYLSQRSVLRHAKFQIGFNAEDIPVKDSYVRSLDSLSVPVLGLSKWLNGAIITSRENDNLRAIERLPFVNELRLIGRISEDENKKVDVNEQISLLESRFGNSKPDSTPYNYYGASRNQVEMLGIHKLHKAGFYGNNINIAVLDAGFKNLQSIACFTQMLTEKRLLADRDITGDQEDFDDDHGTAVTGCMAAYLPGKYMGTAPKANYYLLRTENSSSEYPVEEYFWTIGAEWADSAGADIINSSLGYSKFDESEFGHNYKEFNGNSTIIAIAANKAVSKGMIVMNSAGNEGDNFWKQLTTPADADSVVTVGSVNEDKTYANFSSTGLTSNKKQKPDVAALGVKVQVVSSSGLLYSGKGTSYSCPLLTGGIACLMQADSSASPALVKKALLLSSSQYDNPDKYRGYGIPDLWLTHQLLQSYNKDTLLDVRDLDDKKMHITFYISSSQKIKISLNSSLEEELWSSTEKISSAGLNRMALKGVKNLKDGIYTIKIMTSGKELRWNFEKKEGSF